jgi:hypothetical protein
MSNTKRTPHQSKSDVDVTEPADLAEYFRDPRYTRDQRADFVDDARLAYEESGNALFVWRAIRECFVRMGDAPRDPLPDWVCEYLAQASVRLGWLELGLDFTNPGGRGSSPSGRPAYVAPASAPAQRARSLLPRALGLTTKSGKSAFRDARSLAVSFLLYRGYLELRQTKGASAAFRYLLNDGEDSPRSDAPRESPTTELLPHLRFADEGSARRFLRRMRRLYPNLTPHRYRLWGA